MLKNGTKSAYIRAKWGAALVPQPHLRTLILFFYKYIYEKIYLIYGCKKVQKNKYFPKLIYVPLNSDLVVQNVTNDA